MIEGKIGKHQIGGYILLGSNEPLWFPVRKLSPILLVSDAYKISNRVGEGESTSSYSTLCLMVQFQVIFMVSVTVVRVARGRHETIEIRYLFCWD